MAMGSHATRTSVLRMAPLFHTSTTTTTTSSWHTGQGTFMWQAVRAAPPPLPEVVNAHPLCMQAVRGQGHITQVPGAPLAPGRHERSLSRLSQTASRPLTFLWLPSSPPPLPPLSPFCPFSSPSILLQWVVWGRGCDGAPLPHGGGSCGKAETWGERSERASTLANE